MAGCSFQLLGSLKITFDDEEFTAAISGGKVKLLVYLVLAFDMPQSRKQIAFDFWPDSTEKQALSNLRKLLHDLRKSHPQIDRHLIITPVSIRWNSESTFYSDVREFEQAAKGKTISDLRKAEELYRGELLPGYYEDWLSTKRELLAQTYLNVLNKLISILESQQEYATAILFANKLLVHDKLREETYRTLMRLHSLNNDTPNVIRIFRHLQRTLQDELGIEPAEETTQLLEKLTQNVGEHSTTGHSPAKLIGRTVEWGIMLSAWKQATQGKNNLLLLKGEAGIGKTRLALEFKAWVEPQGDQTALAGCYPSVSALSYTPVTVWLRSLPLPQLSPVRLSELARLLPELLEQYPELPKPNPIQENWQLNQWYEAIERMLLAKQPILLILDDIQWSDTETLRLLSYIFRSNSKAKLLVIATMRTEEYPVETVEHVVSNLRLERKLTEIELAPLSEGETKRLMTVAIGDDLANRHAAGIHAETGGNPLFIVETLREWQMGGSKSGFRLSPLVKSVFESRVRKLSPDQRWLVSVIAAVGRPVSAAFMAVVTNTEEEAALERIERLVQVKVLQEAGDGKYEFTHDIIRENAYRLNNESRRRQCHEHIAHSLTVFHHAQPEAFAAEIAFYYELAGVEKKAAVYYELAASAAEKVYANETRIKYYKKLCSLLPPEQTFPILMKLGEALIIVGNWNEAEITYQHWLERFGYSVTIKERSFCDVVLGNCLRLQGKHEEARFHLERALYHFNLMEDHAGLSLVYGTLGSLYYFRADYNKALYYLLERMRFPDVDKQTKDDCRFFGFIGFLYYDQCEYDKAIHWFKRQIKLATKIRDEYFVAEAMGGLALVYFETDDMDLAYDSIIEKMEISKSIGARMSFAMAIGMLGKYFHLLGSRVQAEQCIAFCLEEAVLIKDFHIAAVVLGIEGCNLMAQHRYEEASLMIGRSIRLSKQHHISFFECDGLYFMSLLSERQNQFENAVTAAEEALLIANRLKRRDMQVNLLVHLLFLKTALGSIPRAVALDQLEQMLEQYPDQQDQAAIRFAMWKMSPESPVHRITALQFNEELYRRSGKEVYFNRCKEMNGSSQAPLARPMPKLAAEAVRNKGISLHILAEIDVHVNRPDRNAFEALPSLESI
ncbi:AAA family ATPase [Brevibacillus reuszeri]|uniref:AAA family ATPase n=1 Tax=Brevibacillus reuszeri TaxID=54915 RepID=UPI0028A2500E|nr:AAA family ATPase [Brevibacillus reuszeri]